MRLVGVDSETHLIQPGLLAPKAVCWSFAEGDETDLLLAREGVVRVGELLQDPDVHLVIHNAPFDLGVLCNEDASLVPLVFDAYRQGRIHCTIVRQKLVDIAFGMRKFRHFERDGRIVVTKSSYSLAELVLLFFNEKLEKEDTWRLSYALLDGIPVERWPEDARRYAIQDAVEALRIYAAQEEAIEGLPKHMLDGGALPNQMEQQCASWALYLMSMWGVRADAAAVDKFIEHCNVEIAKMHADLAETKIFKKKRNGEMQRDMKEIRRRVVESCNRLGIPVPMTDPSGKFPEGQVQTDKEALEATDDPALHVLAAQMTFAKHLGQWGPVCRAAVHRPVCARYEVLVETGRTSCSGSEGQEGTNFQNPPRKGDVRPCFIPRPGYVLCSTDADTIELRAHAQNCLELVGWSKMAEALWDQHENKGPDLHVRLAAAILGIDPYVANERRKEGDVEVGEARQFAKIPNFGFPGGLGAATMITYAAGQLDKKVHQRWFGNALQEQLAFAKSLRDLWFETWPENRQYFEVVNDLLKENDEQIVAQLRSRRIRGDVRFTAAANGFFQGRVADAMKEVLFQLADECYTGRCTTQHAHGGSNLCTIEGRSILINSRPIMFLHDEPIVEHPEDGTESDRAERQRQIVVECLGRWMPDVPCTSSAVLSRQWFKGAEPMFVDGKLVPVKPEKITVDGKDKIRWVHDERMAA